MRSASTCSGMSLLSSSGDARAFRRTRASRCSSFSSTVVSLPGCGHGITVMSVTSDRGSRGSRPLSRRGREHRVEASRDRDPPRPALLARDRASPALRGVPGHDVAVAEPRGPAYRCVGGAADDDRDRRRVGLHQERRNREELALELDRSLCQSVRSTVDHLVGSRSAGREINTQNVELLAHPADADAERETSIRKPRGRRGCLREHHGMRGAGGAGRSSSAGATR